jgi:hypothetical protein
MRAVPVSGVAFPDIGRCTTNPAAPSPGSGGGGNATLPGWPCSLTAPFVASDFSGKGPAELALLLLRLPPPELSPPRHKAVVMAARRPAPRLPRTLGRLQSPAERPERAGPGERGAAVPRHEGKRRCGRGRRRNTKTTEHRVQAVHQARERGTIREGLIGQGVGLAHVRT